MKQHLGSSSWFWSGRSNNGNIDFSWFPNGCLYMGRRCRYYRDPKQKGASDGGDEDAAHGNGDAAAASKGKQQLDGEELLKQAEKDAGVDEVRRCQHILTCMHGDELRNRRQVWTRWGAAVHAWCLGRCSSMPKTVKTGEQAHGLGR